MKMPERSPSWEDLRKHVDPARLPEILNIVTSPSVNGKYVHWDKLRYREPPDDLSLEEWWTGLRIRRSSAMSIPLLDKNGDPFSFVMADPLPEWLHNIDMGAGGRVEVPPEIVNKETRDRYYVRSLVEEAIASSQLEGAITTRQVAREMIRNERKPADTSEQMILNNYVTMQELRRLKSEKLSRELVFEIHRTITSGTLDDPTAAGRFVKPGEERYLSDDRDRIHYYPPPIDQLEQRMESMCSFANSEEPFIYPVIRSVILHFWLAYDHPFLDGNGRTARALFYWSMLRHDYWLVEFLSISSIIRMAPAKYGYAFLYTETDNNDLTYFILYHLRVINRAIKEISEYIVQKTKEWKVAERRLKNVTILNHRQRALISHALRHPGFSYHVASHKNCHNISYETARKDLVSLTKKGVLLAAKQDRRWHFAPVEDLEEKLEKLS